MEGVEKNDNAQSTKMEGKKQTEDKNSSSSLDLGLKSRKRGATQPVSPRGLIHQVEQIRLREERLKKHEIHDRSLRPNHLPHLDGLRAVALTAVILFHFPIPLFEGGFLGVDIFLTMSGFLITRNLLSSILTSSFRTFYLRRFWRLYPACLFTVAASVLLSILCFPPEIAEDSARSALYSLAFLENVNIHNTVLYFGGAPEIKPFLHMWSLGLEVQFYLIWPFLVYAFHPVKNSGLPVFLVFVATCSLAAAFVLWDDFPNFACYLLPCRLYHFTAGTLMAVAEPHLNLARSKALTTSRGRTAMELQSCFALFFIIKSFFVASRNVSPLQMLPVVLCTCILIASPDSFIGKYVLGNPVCLCIGRVSYSAYLVHWPIQIFAMYISKAMKVMPISFPLFATMTAFFTIFLNQAVEEPMRKGGHPYGKIIVLLLLGTCCLCAIAIWV